MTEQSDSRPDGNGLLNAQVREAVEALTKLGASDPELAATLARVLGVVASEAARTTRFARALAKALTPPDAQTTPRPAERPRRSRRAPGVIDPFTVLAESGETGLRSSLSELGLEQLRDIVSEHGMDHDRLALKWKDPQRVIDRIVERVESRTAKGAAFRGRPEQPALRQDEAVGPAAEDSST
ncbi:hypothetical protein [Streptomyces sp. RTGN2]|uniref:hypothetical protein n=1 Tax=Streptomyces sp. RTGN2 TaxID=3016525 RepID=UPI0025566267|nr:hypothetical protein [Streptomyces sp. RTGN2]